MFASTYPGARRPDRQRSVDADGVRLSVVEWGEEAAPPVLFAHGGFDFAGTFDVFAPMIADAGWRVVSWDARGHGDSQRAVLYSWEADIRDALAVLDSIGLEPLPLLGHSKGGALLLQLAEACPHRVSALVNLDGLPSDRSWPDVAEHTRTKLLAAEVGGWLDHRRGSAMSQRRPGTLDELAARRHRMNPRLDLDWLRYLVPIGARHDGDGWRWKIDPIMRMGGFGPWRPEWSMWRLPALSMPVLAVLGLELETMGWGTVPEDVYPYLPPGGRFVPLDDTGHFVHVEKPRVVADLVLDFLGPLQSAPAVVPMPGAGAQPVPAATATATATAREPTVAPTGDRSGGAVSLTHGQSSLALRNLRTGTVDQRALLLLHGLGERTPTSVPGPVSAWPGPVWGLDLTGHGDSVVPRGGGYTAEILMADVDAALAELGEATLLGRGLGAYVALLAAGARPMMVRGAILADGPGLAGGGPAPSSPYLIGPRSDASTAPDPFALFELSRDVRPPDYALTYVRLAVQQSGLDTPVAVAAKVRPPWLAAVAGEPGVLDRRVPEALAVYARV